MRPEDRQVWYMKKNMVWWIPGVLISSIVFFSILYFNANPGTIQPAVEVPDASHPLVTVSDMYRHIEQGDWRTVKNFVSNQVWQELNTSGFREKWQNLQADDSSLDFVSFVVMKLERKSDTITDVLGRAVWVAKDRVVPDETQQITLRLINDNWIITGIKFYPAVDQVGKFFSAVSLGDWQSAAGYVSQPVMATIRAQALPLKQANFIAEDFAVNEEQAWVKGKLVTGGSKPRVVPVSARLKKADDRWQIIKITGGWPEK